MDDATRTAILNLSVGNSTVREMIATIDLAESPARLELPATLCIDIRDLDGLLAYVERTYEGVTLNQDDEEGGSYDDRLYLGWGKETGHIIDCTALWDSEENDESCDICGHADGFHRDQCSRLVE